MQVKVNWTDSARQVRIFLVVAAVLIAVASLVVSSLLVRDLSKEESYNVEVWAEAMRAFDRADENTDLQLVPCPRRTHPLRRRMPCWHRPA